MNQPSLFSDLPAGRPRPAGWEPPSRLPPLGEYRWLALDFETTGLDVRVDKPVGLAICTFPGYQTHYLPWGHAGGGNLPEERVLIWARAELRDKDLIFMNARFDLHMALNWGLDLEAQGCRPHDVQHSAALLDEYRRKFALNELARDFLHQAKLELPTHAKISELPAWEVGPYAEEDARLTMMLREFFEPAIEAEDLGEVLSLEDALIFSTVEMERNGAPLDLPKLHRWREEAARQRQELVLEIYRQTWLRVNPESFSDLAKLYRHLGLSWGLTERENPSFTAEVLKRDARTSPVVGLALRARQLGSLLSKYLDKYARAVDERGILRYNLHQLRNDDYGTVTGRYSSGGRQTRVNIQQVFKVDRQVSELGPDFIIRELFIPAQGMAWVSADASQIEFRLFAHYANSRRLIQAYRDNPDTDFHQTVADLVRLPRTPAKNINFGKLYGMGRDKMARMLGLPRGESDKMFDAYDELFPEARRLMNRAIRVAETSGFVKTLMGRRRRFNTETAEAQAELARAWKGRRRQYELARCTPPGTPRYHAALNAVIQGTAADVMKLKILQAYHQRKELGLTLRFTVHDELDGDLPPDPAAARRLKELLDEPCLPVRVPLTWDVRTGATWRLDP